MSETRYIISDAAKMIDVEPHVLRYWEEELEMDIPRNEMGHRYYTDREVRLFTQVRDLKDKGFQLKAIKMILTTVSEDMSSDNIISLEDVRKNYEDVVDEDITETQVDILNPEDKKKWDVVDSCVSLYRGAGAQVYEVSTLNQLAEFVADM